MGASPGSDPRAFRATADEMLAQSLWLRRLARSLVSDASRADDLVQDAWVAALRSPPEDDRPLRPWLARVVTNLVRTRHRADVTRRERESGHVTREHAPSASEAIEAIDMQRVLLDAVEALPEPQRSTIVRHYFKGLTSLEIAREDGVADSTVRWRIAQAIETLRTRLDAGHDGDRTAWMSALVPLARRTDLAAPAASVTAASGVILMTSLSKLVVAAIAFTLALWIGWTLLKPTASAVAPAVLEPTRQTVVLEPAADKSPPRATSDRAEIPAVTAPLASQPETALPKTIAFVEARVLDQHGRRIFGSMLTCIDKLVVHEIPREETPFATCDSAGRVRLALSTDDAAQGRMQSHTNSPDEWQLDIEASAPGKTRHVVRVTLAPNRTTSLGEIVLEDGGDVRGRVVDDHGAPIANVDVGLILPDLTLEEREKVAAHGLFQKANKGRTRTSVDGSFVFEGVPVGWYRVWGNLDGWVRSVSEPFELAADETARTPDLVMPVDTRVVRGVVLGLDGAPMKNGDVEVFEHESWVSIGADEHGAFLVNEIDGPAVDIYAHGLDRGFEGPDPGQALVAHVAVGTRNLVVQLQPSATAEVVVRDAGGHPIENVMLGVLDLRGSGSTRSARLEERHVRLLGKPFRIVVKAVGYATQELGPFQPGQAPDHFEVVLLRNAKVAGRVTIGGRPVERAIVSAHVVLPADSTRTLDGFPLRVDRRSAVWVWTANEGTFAMNIEMAARWVLVVEQGGFATYVSEPFDVGPEHGKEDIAIALDHGGSIVGRVKGFTGDASEPAFVTMSCGIGRELKQRVAGDGSYEIDNLTPGRWLVRLSRTDKPSNNNDEEHVSADPDNISVDVRAGSTARLDFDVTDFAVPVLEGRISVQGRDVSVWSATLTLSGTNPDKWSEKNSVHVGSDGVFKLTADERGAHRLMLASASSPDRSDTFEQEVVLAHGSNVWALNVATGALKLPADAAGEVTLTWTSASGATWSAHIKKNPGAELVLDSIPAGTVRVQGADDRAWDTTVRGGETTAVDWH